MNKIFETNILQPKKYIEIILCILTSIVTLIISYLNLIHHEPWRDELQAFSLVRNSTSIHQLIDWVRYEGHPLGWYIFQKIIYHFNTSFTSIKIMQWLFASTGLLLFIWKAPFPVYYRVVISFSYFFMYEYAAIARNYGIALPFYFLLCMYFNKKNYLLYAFLILIAMQFSLYSFIIALSIGIFYFLHHRFHKNIFYYLAIFISTIGIVLFKYVVAPPDDIGTSPGWNINPDNYTAAISVIANSFFPIFKFNFHFWNSSIFETFLNYNFSQAVQFIISIFLIFWLIKIYRNNLTVFYIFFTALSIMLFFIAAKYHGSIRHHGHIYILLLMCFWIYNITRSNLYHRFNFSEKAKKWVLIFPEKYLQKVFFLILFFQMLGSAQAFYFENKYPFSASLQAVNFIQKKHQNSPIIGYSDDACTSVAIQLNRKFYHANTNSFREHLIFNNQRVDIMYDTLLARTNRFFSIHPNGILLLSKSNSTYNFIHKMPYKIVFETTEAIRHDEAYIIYTK
ncbi:MAG: hypothetical protein RL065_1171 [Bacteroidota bacterium]|jgi:hypothetical protein